MALPFLFVCIALSVCMSHGFHVSHVVNKGKFALLMVPKYDKKLAKWSPSTAADRPEAGYGIGKTLLLRGPKPFFHRLFQPEDYEQAVLKFMALDKCDRIEAQGNMDAYLENAQDWAFERLESKRTGFKRNYTDIDNKNLALTLVWSTIVAAYAGRAVYCLATDEYYWSFLTRNL
ncbi:hypothetical protein MPSEU_000725100 [Mayamaea pseudoterrestris]|nr:hypothetical protein MPSEU_000725100 [Mayamaea pseudoterrestris]